MSKKLKIIFVIILLLTSTLVILLLNQKNDKNKSNNEMTYVESKKEDKKCITEKESMYRDVYLVEGSYTKLCDYKSIFIQDYSGNNVKDQLVRRIYLMSKMDKDFSLEMAKKYIIKDFTKDLTPLKQLQTYTFLERIYGYNETQIKDIFGIELKHNYRFDKNLSLKKIFIGEGILILDYDKDKLEIEDLDLLDLVANFESDYIIGILTTSTGYDEPYKSINTKEGKEKFINIIRKILKNDKEITGDEFYGALNFLNKNSKIDKDFFNVIKEILLKKSLDKNADRYYNDFIETYIPIIKKYDKAFANTILNNFKQKNEK